MDSLPIEGNSGIAADPGLDDRERQDAGAASPGEKRDTSAGSL
jgi:hypothetical protein